MLDAGSNKCDRCEAVTFCVYQCLSTNANAVNCPVYYSYCEPLWVYAGKPDDATELRPKISQQVRLTLWLLKDFHDLHLWLRPSDMAALRWAYKRGRETARRMASYRGEYAPRHPIFPRESQAACNNDANPVPMDAQDISYTEDDNNALDEYLRDSVETCWHSVR